MPSSLYSQTLQHPPTSVEEEGAGPLKHQHFAAETCRRRQTCIFLQQGLQHGGAQRKVRGSVLYITGLFPWEERYLHFHGQVCILMIALSKKHL